MGKVKVSNQLKFQFCFSNAPNENLIVSIPINRVSTLARRNKNQLKIIILLTWQILSPVDFKRKKKKSDRLQQIAASSQRVSDILSPFSLLFASLQKGLILTVSKKMLHSFSKSNTFYRRQYLGRMRLTKILDGI